MKKILKKIILIGIIFCVSVLFNIKIVNAEIVKDETATKWDVDNFSYFDTNKGKTGGAGTAASQILGTAINTIRIVGTGVSIIMLTYVAIKYMTAAPSEKADFKKSATAFIVGAVVLFAATNILSIISNFATTNIG